MKRIISLILVVLMISAMSALTFANDLEGSYEIIGKASKTEVSAGDTFTYSITFAETDADSFEMACTDATWSFSLNYDSNAFELVGPPTIGYGLKLDNTYSVSSEGDYYAYMMSNGLTSVTFTKDTYILVFTFTAKETATASEFSISNMDMADADSFNSFELGSNLTAKLDTVSFKGGEEVFETGLEGTASTSTVAFFGKNPTNAPLVAGTYGVWFGGVKYPAGINPNTNCGVGEKFVVRFTVDPLKPYSAIPKGTYTYKVYYNDGANMTESTVTIE